MRAGSEVGEREGQIEIRKCGTKRRKELHKDNLKKRH